MTRLTWLVLLLPGLAALTLLPLVLWDGLLVAAERPKIESVDDIIKSREKRRKQLERVVESSQRKLDDHYADKRKLSSSQLERIEKTINAYIEQIEELGRTLSDEELNELLRLSKKEVNRRSDSTTSDEL